ncbi:MAG: hypothetical protein CVU56_07000 [Deltaproteobacteria bacterium HGW-Deltaproteobacteria-14]|jgi:hypothetical protein|nr:MAG: hypothetical protein CVU56_07000 [Deltaproteobacteria bacterium HGW-Deltaproteobacteria-14]
MDDRAKRYSEEIRDYLLGRLSTKTSTDAIRAKEHRLRFAPVLRWWIFEGGRFEGLDGALADNWARVIGQVERLLLSFSPRWRELDTPEGRVDWVRTLNLNAGRADVSYVCQSSGVGLDEDERRALLGWAGWIADHWYEYVGSVRRERQAHECARLRELAGGRYTASVGDAKLRRWAHVARRSRWPLLRNVVAESLRAALEPTVLEQLPLPLDVPTLFELVCLVRVMRQLAPAPQDIRWLIREASNRVAVEGIDCRYQRKLGPEAVLGDSPAEVALNAAVGVFAVRVPTEADLVLAFAKPRAGFDGVLIEVKSGGEDYGAALHQLKSYAAALMKGNGRRYLAWAVVESAAELNDAQLSWLSERAEDNASPVTWAFSGPDDIRRVLLSVGLAAASS